MVGFGNRGEFLRCSKKLKPGCGDETVKGG